MFGDERASAKEMSLFFYVDSGTGLSGFRDNETGDARAYVQSPPPPSDFCKPQHYWVSSQTSNFSTIGQSVLEIWRWGVRVRTCGCTPPMTCGRHLINNLQPTYQI